MDAHGNAIYINMRSTTLPGGMAMEPWLLKHERAKRRVRAETLPTAVYQGIRPFVLESQGRFAEGAQVLIEHLMSSSYG